MKKPLISACLVIFNEEAVLDRCLTSLKGAVDEIIIVHDGPCSDQSLEVAKKYTDKIFIREHLGIAEGHRIFSFEQSTGEWLLWIDADEFLSPELHDALPGLAARSDVDAFEVVWPFWDGTRYRTKAWPYRPVLFRRSKVSYLDFPQEPLRTHGKIQTVQLVMEHRPTYNNLTLKRFRTKWLAWARIQAKATLQPFSEIPKFQITHTDWSAKFQFARDHAYLFPLIGAYCCFTTLRTGGWRHGWIGWKQSLFWGAYNAAVYYYVWKLKRHA